MSDILDKKFLQIIPFIFLALIIVKIIYTYIDIKEKQFEFAKKEAEVLTSYVTIDRLYHQNLFLNNYLKLDKDTLKILPAYSSKIISDNFSKNNKLNITVKTVSDNPRNTKNMADIDELKAIKYFKENLNKNTYFSSNNKKYFQYASVLKIKKACLKCHGPKNEAPLFIQENYQNAYNYKLGDIRGIISVKIPVYELNNYFFGNFIKSIMYDAFFLIFLFIAAKYILGKSKQLNSILKFRVEEKTLELKNSLITNTLTSLPNRLKLIEDIKLHKGSHDIHLAIINIDSFKDINDLYGFTIGDKVLVQVAKFIQSICKQNILYKLPSDEYAILQRNDMKQKDFIKLIDNILSKIQESQFKVQDHHIYITLSCGIYSGKSSLLTKASSALDIAKNDKRNIVVYDNIFDSKEMISKNMEGISILKNAIAKDKITPYFQPIYNTHTKKIEKYECLARIIKDNKEVLTPYHFLDISIKAKLYHEITTSMIKKSFEFFKYKKYEFSINLSISDIEDSRILKFIIDSIENFEEPNRIVFEILESDKIGNYEELKKFIALVKQYGCKIAIDDFGSGYSNFSHILALNVDYLKIDASLVKFITTDDNSRIITKTIINFASSLGLKTIAEFVEDKDALDMLEKMGVDFIQGYYIGKPKAELV